MAARAHPRRGENYKAPPLNIHLHTTVSSSSCLQPQHVNLVHSFRHLRSQMISLFLSVLARCILRSSPVRALFWSSSIITSDSVNRSLRFDSSGCNVTEWTPYACRHSPIIAARRMNSSREESDVRMWAVAIVLCWLSRHTWSSWTESIPGS